MIIKEEQKKEFVLSPMRLTPEFLEALKQAAASENRSLNNFVIMNLKNLINFKK